MAASFWCGLSFSYMKKYMAKLCFLVLMHYICNYRYNDTLMFGIMKLYHGSVNIIENPELGKGNRKNDYGLGLYCTEHVELAKEWACSTSKDGFVNGYNLDLTDLTVCDLTRHHILNWMAILLENRTFDLSAGVASVARDYILQNFLPEYRSFDIIRGYRADDSYFSFARDFLNNSLSLEELAEAMKLGELGEQVVLKSEKAFDMLTFEAAAPVDSSIYHPKWISRDHKAREDYRKMKERSNPLEGTYILDIIRQQWKNDDVRLR